MAFSTLETIASGIVSGLIATLLVLIGSRYWNRVIVPWYENRVYKDIRIAGDWTVEGKEGQEDFQEVAMIHQNAHRVWGEITYQEDSKLSVYEFDGEFRNLILTARYSAKGRIDLDRGTFTLTLRDNGQVLRGAYAWNLDSEKGVVSGPYEWTRKY